jgi:nucleotide sugar dehydrogenase
MGLPLACTFAKHGAVVSVCDVNERLVAAISAGQCPYEEPGLAELMREMHGAGRLNATAHTASGAASAEAVVIIVPARLDGNRGIDLSVLQESSAAVAKGLRRGALVAYETTVAVGVTRSALVPILEAGSGMQAGRDFHVAFSPERVKANLVLSRLETTPKVVGGYDDASLAVASAMYARFLNAPVDEVGSLEAAEMVKLVGMLYRDVNIALANELAAFCELAGVNFDRVRDAANTDGEANLLLPGIGVGGHCTPVYPYFLIRESRRRGLPQRIAEAAREINEAQPVRQLERVAAAWKPLTGVPVHVLGLGFRPGVKVDAFSPAYALCAHLRAMQARPTLEDPHYNDEELVHAGFVPGRVAGAQLVVLNTAHAEFARPNFGEWRHAGVEAVLDGRNAWDPLAAESSGILYFGIGRGPSRRRL